MQPNIFKARCSKIGEIMTEPKGKSNMDLYNECKALIVSTKSKIDLCSATAQKTKANLEQKLNQYNSQLKELEKVKDKVELAETVKTYVDQYMKGLIWGRYKKIKSNAIKKGNSTEYESIENIALIHNLGYIDNYDNPSMENDWLMGTCDLRIQDKSLIIDAKSSWNLSTFPMYHEYNPNKGYEHQLQGYAELYNVDNIWLCYCLNDSPVWMVQEAIKYKLIDLKKENPTISKLTTEQTMDIITDMTFTYGGYIEVCKALNITRDPGFKEIPMERRLRTFKYERDPHFILKVKERVSQINDYIRNNKKFEQDLLTLENKKQSNGSLN